MAYYYQDVERLKKLYDDKKYYQSKCNAVYKKRWLYTSLKAKFTELRIALCNGVFSDDEGNNIFLILLFPIVGVMLLIFSNRFAFGFFDHWYDLFLIHWRSCEPLGNLLVFDFPDGFWMSLLLIIPYFICVAITAIIGFIFSLIPYGVIIYATLWFSFGLSYLVFMRLLRSVIKKWVKKRRNNKIPVLEEKLQQYLDTPKYKSFLKIYSPCYEKWKEADYQYKRADFMGSNIHLIDKILQVMGSGRADTYKEALCVIDQDAKFNELKQELIKRQDSFNKRQEAYLARQESYFAKQESHLSNLEELQRRRLSELESLNSKEKAIENELGEIKRRL